VNGSTRIAPFHVADFNCFDESAQCNLPVVVLPALSDNETSDLPSADGPTATVSPAQ
jgi:hypothetical protein